MRSSASHQHLAYSFFVLVAPPINTPLQRGEIADITVNRFNGFPRA